jgi:hypothetical protein
MPSSVSPPVSPPRGQFHSVPGGNVIRLRRNQYCPIHRSLWCCGTEQVPKARSLRLGVQRIDDPHHPRGYRELRSPAEMRKVLTAKLSSKIGYVPSAMKSSPTITTSCQTTEIPKEWEGRGGTIIQTTFKQHIGGVTKRKDQPEWND